jgi:primase-polymerase (primpol)-like protein
MNNENRKKSTLSLENIPRELQELRQWALWGWGGNSNKRKRAKIPKTLGKQGVTAAKANDPNG